MTRIRLRRLASAELSEVTDLVLLLRCALPAKMRHWENRYISRHEGCGLPVKRYPMGVTAVTRTPPGVGT